MINRKIIISSLLLLSTTISYSLTNVEVDSAQQALKKLDSKDYKSYYYFKSKLKGTNLYPYLQYKEISADPSMFEQSTIDTYYSNNANSYWTQQLSATLAQYYSDKRDWQQFNKYYNNNLGTYGKCLSMQSEYETGNKDDAIDKYGEFWQNRVYMGAPCLQMQKYWDESKAKKKEYVVNKAYTLAFANKFKDALWLLNEYVPNNDDYVSYMSAWQAATQDPSKLDSFISKYHSYKYFNKIFINISQDLVKQSAVKYAKTWDGLKNKKYLSSATKHACISAIAVAFARDQLTQAKNWLKKVNTKYLDTIAWEWILRVNIYNEDYRDYIEAYNKLPSKIQQELAWKYWLAYSYKKTGNTTKANKLFEELTKSSLDYYSFLASDELGKPYNYGSFTTNSISRDQTTQLLKDESVEQALDLYKIGQYKDAASLWKWIARAKLKANDKAQLKQLSALAEKYDMYYEAIFNMALIGDYSNISVLFPKAFVTDVDKASSKYDVSKNLILSITRKESFFDIEAGSYAGAKGLMQVTIPTADFISKKYKIDLYGNQAEDMAKQIYIPSNNITLGAANLDFLDGLFHKNLVLGICAYNAGPGNVAKWLNSKNVPATNWIENIPFGETRHYVRKVLTYMIVYNNVIFKNKPQKISDLLGGNISDKQSFR